MNQFQSDNFQQARKISVSADKRRSPIATWALILALAFFVPLAPVIGLILGVIALRMIAGDRHLTGRWIAIAAIAVAAVTFTSQSLVTVTALRAQSATANGPGEALAAGFDGDVDRFVSAFTGPATEARAREARTFLDELTGRYGGYLNGRIAEPPGALSTLTDAGAPRIYELAFENENAHAEAAIKPFDGSITGWPCGGLRYLTVRDAKRGDLTFPGPVRVATRP